ncbi:MAG: AzlC family ABC transporter permease [Christensenellaceae bacterium]|nr:AzlC family ABC transporter permease [Christensenellaceae bacterium]
MSDNTKKNELLKQAFKATLPVMAGYLVLGIGFGIVLKVRGYSILWALAMSVFIYAGSMQFVAIDLLTGGASLITTALTTLMVNARHLFYGISMVDKYKEMGKVKPYLIFSLTDETYSLVCRDEDDPKSRKKYYTAVSVLNHCYWVTGSMLGAAIGEIIPFSVDGIDFALTALFVTVFVEQWVSTKDHVPALTGVISAVICLLIFGSENFLIPTMILITIALTVLKKIRGKKHE